MRFLRATWHWLDDRGGFARAFRPYLRHPVPEESAKGRSAWMYVLGIGTLTAFILQVVTGVVLATAYVPSTAHAYDSLQFITNDATFGRTLRGIHYFGASAMVILIGAHMIRVFLTGSYKFPRELNWLTGVLLLLLTLGMAFTGQLLRWDADAVGSVFVAAEQAGRVPLIGNALAHLVIGGNTIGAQTLSRFFAFHVFVIPALIFLVVGFHLYLVLHNGISEPPVAGRPVEPASYRAWYRDIIQRRGKPYFPDSAWREIVIAVLIIVVVVVLAVVIGPKTLTGAPDPTDVKVNPRPDWYLLWAFALLAVIPPAIEDYVIVIGPLLIAVVLIALPFVAGRGERSPRRRPWALAVVATAVVGMGALLYTGQKAPWAPDFSTQPLTAQEVGASSGAVYEGSQLFFGLGCQYCHGVDGRGGTRGPNLTDVSKRLSESDIRQRILTGPDGMPSYSGSISEEQLNALVAFLESRSTNGAAK
jgi:ubiquinol-cytochrome c reductase cytochrome b subunit